MSGADTLSSTIARHNDALRSRLHVPQFGCSEVKGRAAMTRGIASLDPFSQVEICASVRDFDGFNPDNDPYGEHDFGSIDHPIAGKVFWKIDYYADASCRFGSEDPSDLSQTYRVLTVMLADEW